MRGRTVLNRLGVVAGARSIAPGLTAAIAVAAVARLVTDFLPSIVAEVSIALLLALVVGLGSLVAIMSLGLATGIGT